jgi:predicted amidophosphoribosyltransferase
MTLTFLLRPACKGCDAPLADQSQYCDRCMEEVEGAPVDVDGYLLCAALAAVVVGLVVEFIRMGGR